MTYGEIIARDLVPVLASLLLAAATAAISIGAAYLRRRWQLELPARTEAQLEQLAGGAVAFAEQWARTWTKTHAASPVGSAKLERALEWAIAEAKRRGLPELARAELVRLIEAQLGGRLLNGHALIESAVAPLRSDASGGAS